MPLIFFFLLFFFSFISKQSYIQLLPAQPCTTEESAATSNLLLAYACSFAGGSPQAMKSSLVNVNPTLNVEGECSGRKGN